MARSWLIDSRGLARKVKNASLPAESQIKDSGAIRECPNCHFTIDNKDISHDWPGLPAGVKFDPSDLELIEHLAAKCGFGNYKPHKFIEEFIPTLDSNDGICCTHPENLPGAKKDGSSIHFFYQTKNAYATGQRKRRKIQMQTSSTKEHVRWHKTGKTKPVMDNGIQRGCKKIMVLYGSSKKGYKPDKCNWVMHQYHLGINEDENEGEYVVAKIFYQQQKQTENDCTPLATEKSDFGSVWTIPTTPKIVVPNLLPPVETPPCDDAEETKLSVQEGSNASKMEAQPKNQMDNSIWLAGESQPLDADGLDDLLWCNETIDPSVFSTDRAGPSSVFSQKPSNMTPGAGSSSCGIAELENLELDSLPDFHLSDLQFDSQDSIFGWLDRL